jgi:hypothetical protein
MMGRLARDQLPQQALPAERDERLLRREVGPGRRQLRGDRREDPARGVPPLIRHRRHRHRVRAVLAELEAALGPLDVHEHRPVLEPDEADIDARLAKEVDLGGGGGLVVDPDDRARRQPEPRRRQRRIRDATAESPAPRIVVDEIARGGADDDDGRDLRGLRHGVVALGSGGRMRY